MTPPRRVKGRYILYICILLFAWALRVAGLESGQPHPEYNTSLAPLMPSWAYIHPDEYFYVSIPAQMEYQGELNPNFFENPSFLINLNFVNLRLTGTSSSDKLDAIDTSTLTRRNYATFPMYFMGRVFSALGGLLVIPALFAVARRLSGSYAGLVAGLLASVAFPLVHHAHYATTSSLATGFVAVSLWATIMALRASPTKIRHWLLIASISAGLATGNRYNAGISFICVGLAYIYLLWQMRTVQTLRTILISGIVGVFTFVLTSPFIVLDAQVFWEQLIFITSAYKTVSTDVEFGLVYIFLYIAVAVLGVVGVPLSCIGVFRLFRQKSSRVIGAIITFIIILYTMIALDNDRTRISEQLILIIVPHFIILVAVGLEWVRSRMGRLLGGSLLLATLLIPTTMSMQFNMLMQQPDTRDKMQTWIYDMIPQDTSLIIAGNYNIGLDPADYNVVYRYDIANISEDDFENADYIILSDASLFLDSMFGESTSLPPNITPYLQNAPVATIERPQWLFYGLPLNLASYWHNATLSVYRLE